MPLTADAHAAHRVFTYVELLLALATFVALFFVTAPYGRQSRAGWGPTLPARWGWMIMETPPVFGFLAIYAVGRAATETTPLVLCALWQLHYVRRAYVYPMRIPASGRPMPLAIVALAITFNLLNAYVNARWISHLGGYGLAWLRDPRFIVGATLFLLGMAINTRADSVLAGLRKPGETGYSIPRGGMYEWISSPNYFGEILEWAGWALATWSLAGLAFALYTFANLAPRARSHHAWYRATFANYPPGRRALIPWVW